MQSRGWLLWTFLSLLLYGLWGIFNSLTSKNSDPYTGIFFSSLGFLISGIIALSFINLKPELNYKSLIFGVSSGLATGLGGLFLLMSLNRGGNINTVIAITAIYPLATFVFSFFMLEETFSLKQLIGVILSVFAVMLLTSDNY